MNDADRLACNKIVAEAVGETSHLKKWCRDAGASEPLCLCEEEGEKINPPLDCSHLAEGRTWETCSEKCTIPPPDFCGDDTQALVAIKALVMQGLHLNVRLGRGEGDGKKHLVCDIETPRFFDGPDIRGCRIAGDNTIAAALKDAMVEEYICCPKCGGSLIGKPSGCPAHGFTEGENSWRLKPALAAMKEGGK